MKNSDPILSKKGVCQLCGIHGATDNAHYNGLDKFIFGGGTGQKVHGILCQELCRSCHIENDTPKSKEWIDKLDHSDLQKRNILLRVMKAIDDGELVYVKNYNPK
jgi:hypothetical protein